MTALLRLVSYLKSMAAERKTPGTAARKMFINSIQREGARNHNRRVQAARAN